MAVDLIEDETKEIITISERVWNFITREQFWDYVMVASIKIFIILVLSYLIVLIGRRIISRIFKLRMKSPLNHSERRQKTLLKLAHSVLTYTVFRSDYWYFIFFEYKCNGITSWSGNWDWQSVLEHKV